MSIFVEALKRWYVADKITIEKLTTFLGDEKITQAEYAYIIQ